MSHNPVIRRMLTESEFSALSEFAAKFPLRFAKAAIIGPRPVPGTPAKINSGTATFVLLKVGYVAITCDHIVREAQERQAVDPNVIFQIGDAKIDIAAQLIDQSSYRDIATLKIQEHQLPDILTGKEIGTNFFAPDAWPPSRPTEGEYVAFGGFPGALRTIESFQDLVFGTWSSGASPVSSSSERQFATHFERDRWLQSFGTSEHLAMNVFGGMSGGPAFILREHSWELVGIVKEYHETFDTVFFSCLASVRDDGSIEAEI